MFRINIKFIICLLSSFLGFYFLGGEMFNIIFYIFITIFIIASINIFIQYKFFNIKLNYKDSDYFVGDTLKLNFILKNKISFLMSSLGIENEYFNTVIYLIPFKNEILKKGIILEKRGIYKVGKFKVCIKDMFNIYKIRKSITISDPIKVYPKVVDLSENVNFNNGYMDHIEKIKKCNNGFNNEQFNIKDIRKYIEGDSLSKIHWKLSAKRGTLLVKNFYEHSENKIDVFISLVELNNEKYKKYDEEIISYVVSILNYMMKNRFNIKIFINDLEETFMELNDRSDFKKLLNYFITDKFCTGIDFFQFISKKTNRDANTLIISLKNEEDLRKSITLGHSYNIINLNHILKG